MEGFAHDLSYYVYSTDLENLLNTGVIQKKQKTLLEGYNCFLNPNSIEYIFLENPNIKYIKLDLNGNKQIEKIIWFSNKSGVYKTGEEGKYKKFYPGDALKLQEDIFLFPILDDFPASTPNTHKYSIYKVKVIN